MSKADVIVLPVIRVDRGGVDLTPQRLLPWADRKNVVDLRRVQLDRAFQKLDRILAPDYLPERRS